MNSVLPSTRSAALVVSIGALAYISTVTQRSSLGVAALDAAERFQTNAEQLSLLAVSQLFIYALMQIPVGLLLDRFGPRLTLAFGAVAMAFGQILVAVSMNLSVAILGRVLVGLGDAFTFISMIRLINGWYEGKKASQLQQWMGNGGQVGQLISAFPFAWFLHLAGWQSAFLSVAGISGICAVAVWFIVRDSKSSDPSHTQKLAVRAAVQNLRESIALPSTRMAFWTHFTLQSSSTALLLLWGVPFLVEGQGLAKPVALAVLSSFVVVGVVCGLFYGYVSGTRPDWRRGTVVGLVVLMTVSWTLLLTWPGPAPLWVILFMAATVGAAGPASMIAFDYTKQFVPGYRLGSTNGFVNIGGFFATFTMIFLVGISLDAFYLTVGIHSGLELYSLPGFKVAMISIPGLVLFGLWRYLVNEKRTFGGTYKHAP